MKPSTQSPESTVLLNEWQLKNKAYRYLERARVVWLAAGMSFGVSLSGCINILMGLDIWQLVLFPLIVTIPCSIIGLDLYRTSRRYTLEVNYRYEQVVLGQVYAHRLDGTTGQPYMVVQGTNREGEPRTIYQYVPPTEWELYPVGEFMPCIWPRQPHSKP